MAKTYVVTQDSFYDEDGNYMQTWKWQPVQREDVEPIQDTLQIRKLQGAMKVLEQAQAQLEQRRPIKTIKQ